MFYHKLNIKFDYASDKKSLKTFICLNKKLSDKKAAFNNVVLPFLSELLSTIGQYKNIKKNSKQNLNLDSNRIVGGRDTDIEEVPHQIVLV